MSYLDRVDACNRYDLSRYLPFHVGDVQAGWVTKIRARHLKSYKDVFSVTRTGVAFREDLETAKARTKALKAIEKDLAASGQFPRLRGEVYAVKNTWRGPELLRMDRGLTSAFGVRAYGVHVNGYVRKRSGLHLWIGTRGMGRMTEPGKLDSMVGGGQPAGMSLMANVIKECDEEAGLSRRLAKTAVPVGALSYMCERDGGLRVDTLFAYDMEVPDDVTPRCQPSDDIEIERFDLMPLTKVLKLVRNTDRFKFNVNLVVLDFAVRHGALDPETEPAYQRIVNGLHVHRPEVL